MRLGVSKEFPGIQKEEEQVDLYLLVPVAQQAFAAAPDSDTQ